MNRTTILRLITATAWLAVIGIAYATLTKVGFVYGIYFKLAPYLMRLEMQTYAHFEHIIAFAILGALFGLAYPSELMGARHLLSARIENDKVAHQVKQAGFLTHLGEGTIQ